MPEIRSLAKRVLNLPDRGAKSALPMPGPPGGPSQSPGGSQGSWLEAAQRLQNRPSASTPHRPAEEASWAVLEERSGTLAARRVGRALLWALIALAFLTGVRFWIWPPHTAAPATAPTAGTSFPATTAQQVAARWATAYLNWDSKHAQDRAQQLAMDMPPGADTAAGWDGRGRQSVLSVFPGAVTTGSAHRARVRVDVLVESSDKTPVRHWVGLDVPVASVGGRVVVAGEPGLVGLPTSAPAVPAPAGAAQDSTLAAATESVASAFFQVYAAGDTSTVTAPGADVPPLPAGVTFVRLDNWTVEAGTGDDRNATAVVTWSVDGAQLEQTYRVALTRVSSAAAQRWQVLTIHGGTP